MKRRMLTRAAAIALLVAVAGCQATLPKLPTDPGDDRGEPDPPTSAFRTTAASLAHV